jgi:methylenetetrahydrofolate dehydrogenase (NADP+)/methenyltetrahydrofolate cyclohydrolase
VESRVLRGTVVRDAVLADLQGKVKASARPPGLTVILVGDDPASQVYVRHKSKGCEQVGFQHETIRFAADTRQEEVLDCIERLNVDPATDGILVQLPLPTQMAAERVLPALDPCKDVDGFHPENLGRLVSGRPRFIPCTPKGILRLLEYHGVPVAGQRVAVVGRSVIVGRPLALLLSLKGPAGDATVTICHSATRDLAAVSREADIVVAAMGVPGALDRRHVREGAVVVDVGINRVDDPATKSGTRLVGDVAPEALEGWAAAYTPVPGGVGPMTIAMLLENTWQAMVQRESAS